MRFPNLTQVVLSTLQSSISPGIARANHDEGHRLRAKILGVIIRKARQDVELSAEDCARYLGEPPKTIEAWEYGQSAPSLAQLESLADCFQLSNGSELLGQRPHKLGEYARLRQRLAGALLRSARRANDNSLRDLGAQTGLDAELLTRYEFGETAIPVHHLAILARALGRDISYFEDSADLGRRVMEDKLGETIRANDDEAQIKEFAADGRNEPFIRLAMAFRDIDRDDLGRLASALAAIIRERRDSNGLPPA